MCIDGYGSLCFAVICGWLLLTSSNCKSDSEAFLGDERVAIGDLLVLSPLTPCFSNEACMTDCDQIQQHHSIPIFQALVYEI